MFRAGGSRAGGIPKNNGELIAAVRRDDFLLAAVALEQLAGGADDLVANVVARGGEVCFSVG